jgi:hypothetical protein
MLNGILQSDVVLNVTVLGDVIMNVIVLSEVILNVILLCLYAECLNVQESSVFNRLKITVHLMLGPINS